MSLTNYKQLEPIFRYNTDEFTPLELYLFNHDVKEESEIPDELCSTDIAYLSSLRKYFYYRSRTSTYDDEITNFKTILLAICDRLIKLDHHEGYFGRSFNCLMELDEEGFYTYGKKAAELGNKYAILNLAAVYLKGPDALKNGNSGVCVPPDFAGFKADPQQAGPYIDQLIALEFPSLEHAYTLQHVYLSMTQQIGGILTMLITKGIPNGYQWAYTCLLGMLSNPKWFRFYHSNCLDFRDLQTILSEFREGNEPDFHTKLSDICAQNMLDNSVVAKQLMVRFIEKARQTQTNETLTRWLSELHAEGVMDPSKTYTVMCLIASKDQLPVFF
jgi:hypothetical protein